MKFEIFKKLVKSGSVVKCIVTKDTKNRPRSFFDNVDNWAKDQGASGLAYFTLEKKIKLLVRVPLENFLVKKRLKN